jgi:hypothetical protein
MQEPVSHRIAKLRKEIAQMTDASRLYLRNENKRPGSAAEHERRYQRLQEILSELQAQPDWKKRSLSSKK